MSSSNSQSYNYSNKYIVLDIVFYANSLNYDQGGSNIQELKKITKWDGKEYVLVSRYALRYSILHHAAKLFSWPLAKGKEELELENQKSTSATAKATGTGSEKSEIEDTGNVPTANTDSTGYVVHPNPKLIENKQIKDFPEFDLFGYMIAKKSEPLSSRTSPVKISHATSLTPYNYDTHFSANLDMMRRYYQEPGHGSNPITIEEKQDFYIYNVVIDVNRVGVFTKEELGGGKYGIDNIKIPDQDKIKRILELIETIFYLKREIKGRMEDLSPWLAIVGLYNNAKYETYLDKVKIVKSQSYKIITKIKTYKEDDGKEVKEIENQIVDNSAPRFQIDLGGGKAHTDINSFETLKQKIKSFLESGNDEGIYVFRRGMVEVEWV
ncbi:MAG: type I-B CRISPR-associated protein Cas7/Cst2/DevR [Nitrososphaeria archaeon]